MRAVELQPASFLVAVLVFAIDQGMLGPFIFNVARQYAPTILGGIGLVTTLLALAIASLFDGGLATAGFRHVGMCNPARVDRYRTWWLDLRVVLHTRQYDRRKK